MLFISSTVSNKIVIGSVDETTTPASVPAQSENTKPAIIDFSSGRNFPSFPIRGDDSPSIKSKLNFSRRNKPTFKFAKPSAELEEEEEEREENVTEQNEFSSTSTSTTTTTAPPTQTTAEEDASNKQFVVPKSQIKGKFPRVKSNLLFNRKNKDRFRLKLAQLSARKSSTTTTTTTTTTSDPTPSSTSPTSPPVSDDPTETKVSLFKPRKKFNLRKKPSFFAKVPDVSITNSLLKFRNRAKFGPSPKEEDEELETTVGETQEVSTESILSVEAELKDDNKEEEETVQLGNKVDHVRKAQKAPLNGNIRVEFKKKTVEDLLGSRGRFSINPDGRKPRVKSNIRAHLANRGQHFGGQHPLEESGETFDGASSQLDLTPFNKEDDNNNKREVDVKQAPVNLITTENEISDKTASKPFNPLTFSLPLLPLEPVILNPRQAARTNNNNNNNKNKSINKPPPLPAAILKHISHITDIRSLPPLPPSLGLHKRPIKKIVKKEQTESNVSDGLEDRIFAEDDEAMQISREQPSNTQSALLDQMIVNSHENSDVVASLASPPQTTTRRAAEAGVPGGLTNKLSAFRALQQQVERREEEAATSSQEEQRLVSLV